MEDEPQETAEEAQGSSKREEDRHEVDETCGKATEKGTG